MKGGAERRTTSEEPGVRIRSEGLDVGGVTVPLRSVGLPYWEIPPARWEECLDAVTELQIPLLRLDIPWALHELEAGSYHWDEQLDLSRLLELAHERGLYAVVRPGPWLGGGRLSHPALPPWVLELDAVVARDATGAAQPAPSAASKRFADEVQRWLGAVACELAPHVFPRGPLVGRIVEGVGPLPSPWAGGALDRSEPALEFFSRFLERKYPSVSTPTAKDPETADLERSIAWVEAGELAQQTGIIRGLACQPALPALVALCDDPAASGPEACALDGELRSGVDALALVFPDEAAFDFGYLRLLGLRAETLSAPAAVLGFPAGKSLLRPRPKLAPATAAAVLAMSGVRALDLDTLVPRSARAEVGAPFTTGTSDADGVASGWRTLFRALDAIGHGNLRRRSDCLLLQNRELARLRESCSVAGVLPQDLGTTSLLAALRVVPRDREAQDRPELDHDIQFRALADGLRRAGFSFAVADTSIAERDLGSWRTIGLVCFERMSRSLAQRLFGWVEDGGTLVIGPRLPQLDWSGSSLNLGFPLEVKDRVPSLQHAGLGLEQVELLGGGLPVIEVAEGRLAVSFSVGRGRLVYFGFRLPWQRSGHASDTLAEIVRALVAPAGLEPCYPTSDPEVETELHQGPDRSFLFVANPSSEARQVLIKTAPNEALREVRGVGQHVRVGEQLRVPARSVLLREVVQL